MHAGRSSRRGRGEDTALLLAAERAVDLLTGLYRRRTHDLRDNGKLVIADITGPALSETLAGGVDLLKLSHEEIVGQSYASGEARDDLVGGMHRLQRAGAASVVLSRGPAPALALTGDHKHARLLELQAPRFEELDHTGAGDSMFAALGVALAGGVTLTDALRVAAAAGALNVTRHGLGSGTKLEIERLAELVSVNASPHATTA